MDAIIEKLQSHQPKPRGRPRKTILDEEREKRLREKCEKQKQWNKDHPDEYKERWMRTFLKNKEKINLRQKEKRGIKKIIKLKEKLQELNELQQRLQEITIDITNKDLLEAVKTCEINN